MNEIYCADCDRNRPEDQEDCDHITCETCRVSTQPDQSGECGCNFCEECAIGYLDGNSCNCPICDDCRDTFPPNSGYNIGDNTLCESCLEQYGNCDDCQTLIHYDDSNNCDDCSRYYCDDCKSNHDHTGIHEHSYKPEPIFHGHGPEFLGVELEVDGGNGIDNLLDMSDDESLFYLKQDCSLIDGFELVTHPMTLQYHLKSFPWQKICDKIKEIDYKSHDTTTCGLHVHVSRLALGKTEKEQDLALSKLIVLFWRHWDKLVTLSRRDYSALAQWSKPNHRDYDQHQVISNLNTCKSRNDRYKAINTQNCDTVEFRLFKGTLNPNTIKATLELVHTLLNISRQWGITKVLNSTWQDVVDMVDHKELKVYIGQRMS